MSSSQPSARADEPVLAAARTLYGLPLEQFTAERNRLAKKLRGEGDQPAATEIASLRKPTLAAWTINQLVRHHSGQIEALLQVGSRLIEEQRRNDDPTALRASQAEQRSAVETLVAGAREILGTRASEETIRTVAETLRAASITDAGRELLAAGRLTEPITTTGWELLAPSASGRRHAATGARSALTAVRRERTKLEKQLRAVELERKDALGARRTLERAATKARREAERAEREVEGVDTRLEKLEGRIRELSEAIQAID